MAPAAVVVIVGLYVQIVRRAGDRMNLAFAAGMAALLLVIGIWYAPRMCGLAVWVWQCTLGDLVHLYNGIARASPAAAITLHLRELGGWQLAGVALLAALVLPLACRRRSWAGLFFMAIGAAQVAAVLLLATLLEGGDLRRGMAGFYYLFIGLTVFAVAGGTAPPGWTAHPAHCRAGAGPIRPNLVGRHGPSAAFLRANALQQGGGPVSGQFPGG